MLKLYQGKKVFSSDTNILAILNHLPGYVYFQYANISRNNLLNIKKAKRIGCVVNIKNDDKILRSIVWIMPWAFEIIEKMHYLELDASFKATKPYAYSIFHAVIYNSSFK